MKGSAVYHKLEKGPPTMFGLIWISVFQKDLNVMVYGK
jgi:hypothetical protein